MTKDNPPPPTSFTVLVGVKFKCPVSHWWFSLFKHVTQRAVSCLTGPGPAALWFAEVRMAPLPRFSVTWKRSIGEVFVRFCR